MGPFSQSHITSFIVNDTVKTQSKQIIAEEGIMKNPIPTRLSLYRLPYYVYRYYHFYQNDVMTSF